MAKWIIARLPDHVCYVEPFGGAMSVLLRKPPSYLEVYNDLDKDVVTFFRVLRERTDELVRAIELTPFSRAELAQAYESATDELEIARRLYVRAGQAIGGPRTQWVSGWRFDITDSRGTRSVDDWKALDHLYDVASRLRMVYIECDDALKVIQRYDAPTTLFYCDPPYVASTRTKWFNTAYQHEMSDEDHRRLAEVLRGISGMAIISSYPCELYKELYAGWHLEMCQARTQTVRNGGKTATEHLWMSPKVMERVNQRTMFGGM